MTSFALDALRRWPDSEAAELRAWDAADTLILDEVDVAGRDVVVIGDDYGAITLGALDRGATSVRVHQDEITGERALAANAEGKTGFTHLPLSSELVEGASLVLLKLPRSLDALDDMAALVAAHASTDVAVIAGGRIKHMSLGMNDVLARHFARINVSLARQKSRLLVARDPMPGDRPAPKRKLHADLGLIVVARGGVFASTGIDIGTRAMYSVLDRVPTFETAIDLGCGTGVLAAALKRGHPSAHVIATDRSAAAVASAAATMLANGLEVQTVRDDGLSAQPDASADLIVLNPPFHSGAAVHTGIARMLFADAARVLRPGGELWVVFNSHLDYKPVLAALVGPTRQISRTTKFTVTASTRPD